MANAEGACVSKGVHINDCTLMIASVGPTAIDPAQSVNYDDTRWPGFIALNGTQQFHLSKSAATNQCANCA